MRIHNLMQDLVTQKVEEFLMTDERGKILDEASKLDVICYVLNRIAPLYVVSGRGLAHTETKSYSERAQRLADITALIHEGLSVVEKNRRQRSVDRSPEEDLSGPWFNFPCIIGRLFYGDNFGPVSGVKVGLYNEGELMRVIDPNWQNPYEMVPNTAGTFLFWPYPIRARASGEQATFTLEIRVHEEGFEPLRYGFTIALTADDHFSDFASITTNYRLRDLYLFPQE